MVNKEALPGSNGSDARANAAAGGLIIIFVGEPVLLFAVRFAALENRVLSLRQAAPRGATINSCRHPARPVAHPSTISPPLPAHPLPVQATTCRPSWLPSTMWSRRPSRCSAVAPRTALKRRVPQPGGKCAAAGARASLSCPLCRPAPVSALCLAAAHRPPTAGPVQFELAN